MRPHPASARFFLAALVAGVAGCVHVPPGTSVQVAMAKKPEVVRYPTPPAPATPAVSSTTVASGGGAGNGPGVEKTELIADAYSRGEFCMKAGKTEEAITAFQEVVRIDPKFAQAWTNLAALYESEGREDEAIAAFRKAKMQ